MTSQIWIRAAWEIQGYIGNSVDCNVGWRDMKSAGEQPFFVAVHLFRNTAQVSLKACALLINSLPITGLSSHGKSRWEQIIDNRTLIAYFPVSYESINVDDAFLSLNPLRNILNGPSFCHFFKRAWNVDWKVRFPLHFMDTQPLCWRQISCMHYDCILYCRYSGC